MPIVTPERYAQGMTFDEYVAFIGSPANLARELDIGRRQDYSAFLREAFKTRRLTLDQAEALLWLVSQPNGPAKMLAISEEWSSDCRRDIPTFARMAAVTGMELRIFTRDGQAYYDERLPPEQQPPDSNHDLMAQFLNYKNGRHWASIPVCAFFTRDFEYLYHYSEQPAIYDKDRLAQNDGAPLHGERAFSALLASPFFRIWTSAVVDEIVSALHRKLVIGKV
jgi:hypothetical protein